MVLDKSLDLSSFLGLEKNVNTDLKEVLGEQRKLLQGKNSSRNVMVLDCLKRKPRKQLLRDLRLSCQVRGRSGSLKLVTFIHLGSPFQRPCFKEKINKDRVRGTYLREEASGRLTLGSGVWLYSTVSNRGISSQCPLKLKL